MSNNDKYITLPNNLRVHYVEAGPADGFPVLLVHGFLGSTRDWRHNIEALATQSQNRYRVIAVDWVGFGLSDKPEVAYSLQYFADFLRDFADAMQLSRFNLVGHSMGGKHALAFAILHPGYVNKLALVDTDGFIKDPIWTNLTTSIFRPIGVLFTELLGKPQVLKKNLETVLYDKQFLPDEREINEVAAQLSDPVFKRALLALNENYPRLSMRQTGLIDRVGEVSVPVLIFWGQQDRLIPVASAFIAQARLCNARLYVFDHCGHFPQVEHSAEFNRILVDFLAE